ncbi:MAG: hypothetical protein A3J93_02945 [Candidatus Magasanikbacteria bacterium RIFOXYC2_FULL_42_28]|uniref:DUF2341 domain-containing protein n=1 Tax=Candidatus Magasanikbacteria bacterium RIFOXYC2_FULL_42_28 TaxID=1798704 RepID=A0A1F6NU71_9BACT|nr:MAG: hypothetical protein A3J93_02945 [Candidatus Magasanikbacteria bacterium RIFOXYC2_FULL_42_28]
MADKFKHIIFNPRVRLCLGIFVFMAVLGWVYSGQWQVWRNPDFPPKVETAKAATWYNASWSYRKTVTIDYTKVSTTLSNFPVMVSTTDSNLSSYASSTGADILFTSDDGTTKLNHEIESYTSATGKLIAWVNVTSLSNSANTVLYMYYGNTGAADQQNITGTWDSNYVGVWHMKENPSGSAPQMKDSTTNANHGTTQGSMPSGSLVNAQIGDGLDFNGSSYYVSLPVTSSLNITGAITVETWVYADALSSARRFVSKNNTVTKSWELNFESAVGGLTTMRVFDGGTIKRTQEAAAMTVGSWFHYVGVFDPSTAVIIYKNGSQSGALTSGIPAAQNDNPNIAVLFARSPYAGCVNCYLDGKMDEVRVSNVARSAGWILTEYNNQYSPSTFYSIESTAQTPPFFDQIYYKFFNNADSTDVGLKLANQNLPATLSATGDPFRLRLGLHVTGSQIDASGQSFKLQFAEKSGDCDGVFSGESYADVTGATAIAYYDNATPNDGDSLTINAGDPNIGNNVIEQTYEEANNFTNSVGAIAVGEEGLWDFSLYDNGAPADTSYCLRVIKSDGNNIDSYTEIPEIITASGASPVVSVSVQDGIISYGYLSAGSSTTTIAIGDSQTVTNNGNVDIDLGIKGSTSTPGNWTLASQVGPDQYVHEYSVDVGDTWVPLTADYQLLVPGVPPDAGGVIDFRIQVPSSTSDYSTQNVDVTILAIQS